MTVDNQYSRWDYFESDNFDNKASFFKVYFIN